MLLCTTTTVAAYTQKNFAFAVNQSHSPMTTSMSAPNSLGRFPSSSSRDNKDDGAQQPITFSLLNPVPQFILLAKSQAECNEWISAIRAHILLLGLR